MSTILPLQLYLLAHPASESAKAVADALMHRFMEPPASGGLRIPVRFTPELGVDLPPVIGDPDGLVWDTAEHTIVVILADERMVRTAGGGTGKEWAAFADQVIAAAPVGQSPHHVLPIALDEAGFGLVSDRHILSAPLNPDLEPTAALMSQLSETSLHVAARAIQLLDRQLIGELRPEMVKAPVQVFISHAKADLSKTPDDPARQTIAACAELPIDHWFDAGEIDPSERFDNAIAKGIQDSTVLLAFHTDHYGSRPWCRREVLAAKEKGIQVVVVDAMREGEARLFPYMGNAPCIRWSFTDPAADARRVVDRAVLEALKTKHNRAVLEQRKQPGDVVLAGPPEAVTLAYRSADAAATGAFLYPDPPLTHEELDLLRRLAPSAEPVTPLTRIAQWTPPKGLDAVAVSISKCSDIRRYGLSDAHQQTLSDEIHLYLLMAGLRIGYGGSLKGNFDDADNFTLRLFELVRGYAKLAEEVTAGKLHPIINYIPWPLILDYGDSEWRLFGREAEDKRSPRPDLGKDDDALFPPTSEGWRLAPKTAEQRYAWARGLTLMRKHMTDDTQARIVTGGNLDQFLGLVPGVVEEAWMSLSERKPLYLVGAFGGCARALADQLMGTQRAEFSDDHAVSTVPDYAEATQLYERDGVPFTSVEQIGRDLTARSKDGIAEALANGLDEDENRQLIRCSDPLRISELILTGLSRLAF